jgi:hypothetical protein
LVVEVVEVEVVVVVAAEVSIIVDAELCTSVVGAMVAVLLLSILAAVDSPLASVTVARLVNSSFFALLCSSCSNYFSIKTLLFLIYKISAYFTTTLCGGGTRYFYSCLLIKM